jgi:TolB protein
MKRNIRGRTRQSVRAVVPTALMKPLAIVSVLCIAFSALGHAGQRKIAYERGDNIFVADIDGTHQKKIATGACPEISPDGAHVAFNTESDAKTRPGPERHIAIADLANGKVTVLRDIPSDNCFGPVWSSDGSQVAFYIMSENDWEIGVVKSDGSGFRFLKKAGPNRNSFWSMCWAPDDRSFLCQDLKYLYQFALDGQLIKQWDIDKLTGGSSMSSGNRLEVSPNGRHIIFDVDLDEESTRKDWDGPPPGIFLLDLESGSATRVLGKVAFVWEPFWLSNDEFLCIMQKENEKEPSIYRMSLDGKNPKLLVKHARTPSASAP